MWRAEDTGGVKAIGSVASNRWWHGWRSRADGRVFHPLDTVTLMTSPGSHSAVTSKGRQQTSQSVMNRWLGMLVSNTISRLWPQKGHSTVALASMR